jgi:general secretion pathway protein C
MRRLPLIVSFLLFIALCASAAYWAMQLFKPPLRPVAAPPRAAQAEIRPDAAASLFGNRSRNVVAASNYQLRGVIFSGSAGSSVAIISADGKPAQAIRVDMEVAPGVTIKEVHRDHVLLSEGGATKRVDLPENAKGLEALAVTPAATRPTSPPPPAPSQPIPTRAQAAAAAQAQAAQSAQQPQTATPQVPQVPTGQQPQRALTPQTAPSPPQAASASPPGMPPATQPVPPTTTAPPTTVVSPPAAVPGATAAPPAQPPVAAPAAPAAPVAPVAPVAPSRQSLPGVPPGPMR